MRPIFKVEEDEFSSGKCTEMPVHNTFFTNNLLIPSSVKEVIMASQVYCSNVALELKSLSEKLHKLARDIDHTPSIDKYKLTPQIQDLHIIMTELDDRICGLLCSCRNMEGPYEKEVLGTKLPGIDPLDKNKKEFFDYDFGG